MSILLYRTIWLLASPIVLLWSLQQMIVRRGGLTYLSERFGLPSATGGRPTPIWFHAASVGEMRLLAPLVDVQREKGVLITCNTPEAHRLARSIWGDTVTVRYCPLDYRLCIKRFISRHRPSIIFVVETEIWPELYQQCHRHGIAIYIVNGRISDTTFRSTLARQWIYPPALERVTAVWAREPEDAKRFIEMGCAPDKTHTTGSIKMTRRIHTDTPKNPLPNRSFTLAISTHPGEEEMLAEIWRGTSKADLLVLIPRHPSRTPAIVRALLAQGLKVTSQPLPADTFADIDILVVDTVGEVDAYCAHAKFVFVGGSMTDTGGHNVFEPASWGKPIIVGPHTQNFATEVEYLATKDAISIVETTEELRECWRAHTHDDTFRQQREHCTQEAHAALPDRIGDYVDLVDQAVRTRV